MKRISLFLLICLAGLTAGAQSFPVVITNTYQTTGNSPLNLHIGSVGSSNLTQFQVNKKLVASAAVPGPAASSPSNGSSTSYWWQVDLPGTTAAQTAYCAAGSTFSNPVCSSSYITITAANFSIRTLAGGTAFVTIGGITAKVFSGQRFGWSGSQVAGGVTWYQIDLPDNCSQTVGWVSSASATLGNSNGSGLPTPVLSATAGGNAVNLNWTMNVQPTGTASTVFTLYRSVNGAAFVQAILPVAPPDNFTDNSYSSANSYAYYIAAGYGSCTLQNSNTVTISAVAPASGHIQVNITPANIGATWSLDGSGSNNSSANLTAAYGTHTISFNPVPGYTTPSSQTINLTSGSPNGILNASYAPLVNCTYPPAPTGGISATVSSSQIDLGWQAVSGAASYRIYDCNGTILGSSTTANYQATGLQAATTYNFKLTSVNAQGCESQTPSACFSSTTMANAGSTYTLSGKAATSSGIAIAGATISAGSYSGTTDAAGNYSITNIPAGYSGTLSAMLAGYTFSPASLAFSATNDAGKNFTGTAAAGSYTVSGTVTSTAGGGPVQGVLITTLNSSPVYSATTDANGNYSFIVPGNFAGFLYAQSSLYTFGLVNDLTVNSNTHTGKDFFADPIPVTAQISIIASTIPPWQREGDAFNGVVNVDLSKAAGNSWHLEIDIYQPNSNTILKAVKYPATTARSTFFDSSDPQIAALITNEQLVSGCKITYNAVLESSSGLTINTAYTASGTSIIDAKWAQKNVVFVSSGNKPLLIPLKYISNTTSVTVSFLRQSGMSTFTDNFVNIPVQTGNQQYFVLDYSLIKNIKPGIFNYTINYNSPAIVKESGAFDLTKIGNIHNVNSSSNRIVVLVGGIGNDIEGDVNALSTSYDPKSNSRWSLANDLSLNYNRNTWYIAQSNMNSTQKNAYDLGIALEQIRNNCIANGASDPQISVIAHNKAGLEMRVLLAGKGAPISTTTNFSTNPSNPFTNTIINGTLKTVIFLGTPHHGDNFGLLLPNTVAGTDILPSSPLIKYLNTPGGPQTGNIRIGNITGYEIEAQGNFLLDVKGDGLVDIESSSESININGSSLFRQYFIADDYNPFSLLNYLDFLDVQEGPAILDAVSALNDVLDWILGSGVVSKINPVSSFNSALNKSMVLNNTENSCADYATTPTGAGMCQLKVTGGNSSTLSKILALIDNTNISPSCPNPQDISCLSSGQTYASLLSNATISKYQSPTFKTLLTKTDENGKFQFQLSDSLKIGDRIIIEAPGVEPMIIPIDSNLTSINKFNIAMLKKDSATQKIKYPVLKLSGQIPIVSNNLMPLKVSAVNAKAFDIKTNKDTLFRHLSVNDTTSGIPLDTGLNIVLVKYIGMVDTVLLNKTVYYLPGKLMSDNTYNISIGSNNATQGAKIYVNNNFYQEINSSNIQLPILSGHASINLSHFGFKDVTLPFDSAANINLPSLFVPISYSSLKDSDIMIFQTGVNPQYWKNITIKNISPTSNLQISIKQFDDTFFNTGLKPQSRKFIFRNVSGGFKAQLKTAIILDQPITPNVDSVYLLSSKNGVYTKYPANQNGLSEYNPQVQKLAFDSLSFKLNEAQEITLMQKLAPVVLNPGVPTISECQVQSLPVNMFVRDPDSLKNDLVVTSADNTVIVNGNVLQIKRPPGTQGAFSFTLAMTHDFITVQKTFSVNVTACPISPPSAFTPNGDGINDTWDIAGLNNFPNSTVDIFDRYGARVFHSVGYGKAWDGTLNRARLPFGAYYYIIKPNEAGYSTISGNVTIIR